MTDLFATTETACVQIVVHNFAFGVVRDDQGEILQVTPPVELDPVRAFGVRAVNGWLAAGVDLQTQALRLLAAQELVAGLLRHECEGKRNG